MIVEKPTFDPVEGEVYAEALDTLERANVRYMLGGALSLHSHTGIWRNTKDLDVFMPQESVARALETLEAAGFETEVTDPHWLAKAQKSGYLLDIIHANDNGTNVVKEFWFEKAGEAEVLGHRVPVLSSEQLLLCKLFVASRDRWDLSDILHLIFARRGELDWNHILIRVGEHWELLLAYLHLYRYVYPSHVRYVPENVLKCLSERYENEPTPGGFRFRGTMLDKDSFAVDVEAWGLPDERRATREEHCSGRKA